MSILQCPPELPLSLFEEECRFFELPEEVISKLRVPALFGNDDAEKKEKEEEEEEEPEETFRVRVWNVINDPETSKPAKLFAFFSIVMIVASILSTCLESIPQLQSEPSKALLDNPWSVNDLILNSWFLLELLLSIICTPDIKEYLMSVMSWIDIIAVVPYFITLIVAKGNVSSFVTLLQLYHTSSH